MPGSAQRPERGVWSGVVGGISSGEECSRVGLMECLWAVHETTFVDRLLERLHQTQLAGPGDRFRAPVGLEFAKDSLIVPFHCF